MNPALNPSVSKLRTYLITSLGLLVLPGVAGAQSLAKYAPPGALLAIELNDFQGAKRTANAFVAQYEALELVGTLLEAQNVPAKELAQTKAMLGDFVSLVDREGLVAVYINPVTLEPDVLLAARPNTNANARVKKMLDDALLTARKSGSKVLTGKAGGFPMYTIKPPSGDFPMSMGYQGGIAFAGIGMNSVGGFLKRVGGAAQPGLASSSLYKSALEPLGSGNMRVYADFGQLAGLAKTGVARADLNENGAIKLQPLLAALTTLGRYGSNWRVAPGGLENLSNFVPDIRGGDAELYKLLTSSPDVTLKAASVVPANVISFSTSKIDANGWYAYFSKLADKTKLNPGGLDPLIAKELGIDLKTVGLSWMTGEFASASFETKSRPNASNAVSVLGEAVTYIGTTDEALAQQALDATIPRLVELGNKLAQQEKTFSSTASKAMISGVQVTRYPVAQGVALVSAIQNGYLMIATSDDAMIKALGTGPRLGDNATFKTAIAKVPTEASSYGYNDVPASIRSGIAAIDQNLDVALAMGMDIKPSAAKKLAAKLKKLLNFTLERVGPEINWTITSALGARTRSFQPVRW
jgi:Protein of unknown function (DUF3352)